MKGRFYPIVVGLLLIVITLSLQFSNVPLTRQAIARLDYLAYDLRLKANLDNSAVDPRIVIVDIDEKSLRAEGHWPWPRDRLAALVDELFAQGAVVIAFDVVFAEAERNPGRMVLDRLAQHRIESPELRDLVTRHLQLFDNNAVFVSNIRGRDVVLGNVFEYAQRESSGVLAEPLAFTDPQQASRVDLPRALSYTGNAEALSGAGVYGGFFTVLPDDDGIIRRAQMLQRFGDDIYPLLSLEAVRRYLLVEALQLKTAVIGGAEVIEEIRLADYRIPTDRKGRAMVPYRGPRGSYPYISATDVLNHRVPESVTLPGSIVLVGTTAAGLFDLRATPLDSVYPGVEVHANIISGILDQTFPVEPSWATGANFSLTVAVGLLLVLSLPFLSPLGMIVMTALVGSGVVAFNFWLWSEHQLVLSLAPLAVLVSLLGLFNIAYGFLVESRGRRRLKDMFGQYVPQQLVEEMNRYPDRSYGFEGESRVMSVLFCDIRSFTTISERLTAAQLKKMLNEFFTPMTRVIFENRGTIDKYVGDMIMAFWGAPVPDEQHAVHAIKAALFMLEECEKLRPAFRERDLPEVRIGIGINTGLMNVGDMGSHYRRAYTVLGDSVNLASRLEGATKDYGVALIVGEETREQAADAFVYRELDRVRVKGKAQPITIYQPICPAEQADSELHEELAAHDLALGLFRARRWEEAREAFQALSEAHPETRVYTLYLERIQDLSQLDLGEEWDGVFVRTTK